jgi:hypothetical protein
VAEGVGREKEVSKGAGALNGGEGLRDGEGWGNQALGLPVEVAVG